MFGVLKIAARVDSRQWPHGFQVQHGAVGEELERAAHVGMFGGWVRGVFLYEQIFAQQVRAPGVCVE